MSYRYHDDTIRSMEQIPYIMVEKLRDSFKQRDHASVLMEQALTCANHSDEEILLHQVGWNNFVCPKCGRDYSIGRKVLVLDPKIVPKR